MITVQGYVDGVSYAVQIGGDSPIGMRDRTGMTSGSPAAVVLLDECDGDVVAISPVGPSMVADASTPEGALAILHARTQVTSVEGDDVPDLLETDGRALH